MSISGGGSGNGRERGAGSASGGMLVEQAHLRLQPPDLRLLDILVHALALEATRTSTLACTRLLRRGRLHRSDDEVVELREDVGWKSIDLELDLLLAL